MMESAGYKYINTPQDMPVWWGCGQCSEGVASIVKVWPVVVRVQPV